MAVFPPPAPLCPALLRSEELSFRVFLAPPSTTPLRPAPPTQTAWRRPASQWEALDLQPRLQITAGSVRRAAAPDKIDYFSPLYGPAGNPRKTGWIFVGLPSGQEETRADGPGGPRDLFPTSSSCLADMDNDAPSLRLKRGSLTRVHNKSSPGEEGSLLPRLQIISDGGHRINPQVTSVQRVLLKYLLN